MAFPMHRASNRQESNVKSCLGFTGHQRVRHCPPWSSPTALEVRNTTSISTCKCQETPQTNLEKIIRRKQSDIQALLDDIGMDALEDKLSDAVQNPAQKQYRLGTLFSELMPRVRTPASSESNQGRLSGLTPPSALQWNGARAAPCNGACKQSCRYMHSSCWCTRSELETTTVKFFRAGCAGPWHTLLMPILRAHMMWATADHMTRDTTVRCNAERSGRHR